MNSGGMIRVFLQASLAEREYDGPIRYTSRSEAQSCCRVPSMPESISPELLALRERIHSLDQLVVLFARDTLGSHEEVSECLDAPTRGHADR